MKPRRLQVPPCSPADPAAAELWAALQARRCRPRYFAPAPGLAIGFRGPACVALALVEAGGFRVEILGRRWWLARLAGKAARNPRARAEALRRASRAVSEAARSRHGVGGGSNLQNSNASTDAAPPKKTPPPNENGGFPAALAPFRPVRPTG